MAKFEKGHPKVGGRKKKQVSNINTDGIREDIAQLVTLALPEAFNKLNEIQRPDEWLKCLIQLLKYVLPSLQAVEVSRETQTSSINDSLKELAKLAGL